MNRIRLNIPNAITCLNLLSGIAAIIFAFRCGVCEGGLRGYEWSALFILFSAVCDFFDGFSARLLRAYSDLGKQLDSLSDLVSFGVAPAMLVLNCAIYGGTPAAAAWLALMIPVCGALRLARFNLDSSGSHNFRGLPIPSCALFCIGLSFYLAQNTVSPWLAAAAIVAVSLAMVSRMRMYSLKISSLSFKNAAHIYLLAAVSAVLVCLMGAKALLWIIIFYAASSFILRNTKYTD